MADPLVPPADSTEVALSEAEQRWERRRKLAGVVLTPLAFAGAWLLAGGMPAEGRALAGILAATGTLWITEPIPLPVTAILGVVLCVLLGVADAKTALAPFADPVIFLFIGSFMLARAMTLHRLDRRLALGFLSIGWIARHPARVLGGLGLMAAAGSMWISNTATAAMMLPIALGILGALRGAAGGGELRDWPFSCGMMLIITYSASVGGIGTPVGSPPNLIAVGLVRSLAGVEISFLQWMALGVPMLLVMGAMGYGLLLFLHPPGQLSPQAADKLREHLRRDRAALGRWTVGEWNTLAAFGLAVAGWVLPGILGLVWGKENAWVGWLDARLPEAVVALAAACLLFVLPVDLRRGQFTLTWQEAARIDWGTILLFGGGMSLGALMFRTGVAESMARGLLELTGADSLWMITALAIGMGIVLSETTSNTASATMLIPAVIALAQAAGVDPVPPALGACFGSSFGFMLPVSTPPNAIIYGSGLVSIRAMVRAGLLFDLAGFAIILIGLRLLCPLVGLSA